jgi:hypothetical protein
MAKKNAAGSDGLMKKLVITLLIASIVYIVWCWVAKMAWQTEPPMGADMTAIATIPMQLFGMSLIQVSKNIRKKTGAEEEAKALRRENTALKKQLDKAAAALGGEQIRVGE